MDKKESKISNVEWGLVIGVLFLIDLIQIGLDLLAQVGVILNRFIDIFVGLSLGFYLQLRGQSLADPKRLIGLIGTFFAEEIPDLDALPFWGLDGIYNMSLSKSDKIIGQIPGASNVVKMTPKNNAQTGQNNTNDTNLENAA